MGSSIPRTYVLVRVDIPLASQLVQVAHVCLQAGAAFGVPAYSHLVLCAVPDEKTLLSIGNELRELGIEYRHFFEPDGINGRTALCTAPLTGKKRSYFQGLVVWGVT